MKKVYNIPTINDYNDIIQHKKLHPLVSLVDFSTIRKSSKHEHRQPEVDALTFGFYAVFLKEEKNCDIRYGRNYYDYQEGTLIFIAPGQVVSIEEDGQDYQPTGIALLFHPDLIRGASLGHNMKDYTFFSYRVYEALHLSDDEKQVVIECFQKIDYELRRPIDKHSKKLIVTNIELLLNYSVRFYDRQFITRDHSNIGILEKFESMLTDYLNSGKPQIIGTPTVAFFANEFNLSANYFGDLIKKETGKSAQEFIQSKLVDLAKDKMFDITKPISQISSELGFKYPQHFTRFFKQQIGQTPNDYRNSISDN